MDSIGKLNISKDAVFDYSEIELDNPPRFYPYKFEEFDWKEWCRYVSINWYFCVIAGIIYVVTIFGLKTFMNNRAPFVLKWQLFVWNATLGIFSIIGFIRSVPELYSIVMSENGFYRSICVRDGGNMPMAYWSLLFVLSKYVELGDTVFIVLRKKPLILLQWYHHLVTLIFAWITAPYIEPISRYYVAMNYGVHSLMYPYFSISALGMKIPRIISNFITTCQLSQMLIGLFVNMLTTILMYKGTPCCRHEVSIGLSFVVYGSFAILFGKLFNDVIAKSKKAKILKEKPS